jgi:hypothetical protein
MDSSHGQLCSNPNDFMVLDTEYNVAILYPKWTELSCSEKLALYRRTVNRRIGVVQDRARNTGSTVFRF